MNISTNQNQNSPGNLKEELDDFERFALDNLVRNEWGLKVTTMNRLIYCGVSVECLGVIEEHDLNDIFNDERAIGQKILLRHRLREWRKGLHWNSPEQPTPAKRRYERRSTIDRWNVDNKPSISTSHQDDDDVIVTTPLMLPDTNNQTTMVASSSSSPSSVGAASTMPDSAGLPIQITPATLREFLQNSRTGRWIWGYYSENGRLDKKALTELTHILVDPFLTYNIAFTHALMRHYADVIVTVFPSEKMETFYSPRNTLRKNPTGKLYDRYVNQRLRYKTKFNAQRPMMVNDSLLHRTFGEMTTVAISNLQQQYLDFTGGFNMKIEANDLSLNGNLSEESMNVYRTEDGVSL